MCFFVPWLCEFVSNVIQLTNWLIFAAVLVTIGAVLNRWYLAAVGLGVALMFFALVGGWLGDDSDKIKRLEAELQAKTAQLGIERATNDELEKHLAAEAGISEHNAGVIGNLQKQIDAMEDRPECGVSKDFTDALKDIR